MPDYSMFGYEQSGGRMALDDMQRRQMNDLTIQKEQLQIQDEQGKLQDQAKARQQQQIQQQQAQQEQTIMQATMLRNQNASQKDIALDLMKSGHIQAGTAMMEKAATIEEKFSVADKNKADAEVKQIQSTQKKIYQFRSAMGDVNSQEEYDAAVQRYENTNGVKAPAQFKDLKWSPETKQKLLDLSMTWEQNQKQKMDTLMEQRNKAKDDATVKLREAETVKTEMETRLKKQQVERESKVGGLNSAVARTPKEDIVAATNLMKADFPGLKGDSVAATNAASYIASRAQLTLRNNKGLDRETALYQAYSEAKESGDLKMVTDPTWFERAEESFGGKPKHTGETSLKFNMSKPITPAPPEPPPPPEPGDIHDGYKFNGGDPASPRNWKKR